MNRIAVIGGGASGTLTAIQLLKNISADTHIILIEKTNRQLYRGHAYSSTLPYEPLNVPTGKMSAFVDLHDDFYNWITTYKPEERGITKDSFVSRRWFGEYLTFTLQEVLSKKPETVSFEAIEDTVTDLDTDANGVVLLLKNSGQLRANFAVLATGNEPPETVFDADDSVLASAKYAANPWDENVLKHLQPTDNVLLIGSGLTMVDFAVSLKTNGHQGALTAISKKGLLPKIHQPAPAYTLSEKLANADIDVVFERLQAEIKKAAEQNKGWRSVLDALRPQTVEIWQQLSPESKQKFIKHYRQLWEKHRHRMPQNSAEHIDELLQLGSLQLLAGKINRVRLQQDKFCVLYTNTEGVEMELPQVDFIINCTGPAADFGKSSNQLYQNLLRKKQIQTDEHHLGIVSSGQGEILQTDGKFEPRVLAIGPLRKASEWETTAIREIRQQAEDIARHLANQLQKQPSTGA